MCVEAFAWVYILSVMLLNNDLYSNNTYIFYEGDKTGNFIKKKKELFSFVNYDPFSRFNDNNLYCTRIS